MATISIKAILKISFVALFAFQVSCAPIKGSRSQIEGAPVQVGSPAFAREVDVPLGAETVKRSKRAVPACLNNPAQATPVPSAGVGTQPSTSVNSPGGSGGSGGDGSGDSGDDGGDDWGMMETTPGMMETTRGMTETTLETMEETTRETME